MSAHLGRKKSESLSLASAQDTPSFPSPAPIPSKKQASWKGLQDASGVAAALLFLVPQPQGGCREESEAADPCAQHSRVTSQHPSA